jgi:hypothetical protein
VSKQFKPGRTIVQPPVSRIRREPITDGRAEQEKIWRSREWEIRLGIIGITLFALAIFVILVGGGAVTN